ncbi:hypothetical protein LSAT2_000519 [Lamellibrachia satsuma]|nr:hypothetical protein LSAT2_000519 [Lamellibrachia satsuma]
MPWQDFWIPVHFTSADDSTTAMLILEQDRLIVLIVNYMFLSMFVTLSFCLIMCFTQSSSGPLDERTTINIMAVCFIMINIVVADCLVYTMHTRREVHTIFK